MANYESQFAIGDAVKFRRYMNERETRMGSIVSITFTKAKVFYGVLDDYTAQVRDNVDSRLVIEPNAEFEINESRTND
jgi:hypothetical protein